MGDRAASIEVRRALGGAFALVRSMSTATALAGYTLEDLITEQIFFLDASQQGEGADLDPTSTIRSHATGRLQRLESLEAALFGDDGAFRRAREIEEEP